MNGYFTISAHAACEPLYLGGAVHGGCSWRGAYERSDSVNLAEAISGATQFSINSAAGRITVRMPFLSESYSTNLLVLSRIVTREVPSV